MSVRIGIPSAMYDFEYRELWDTFFYELGAKVVHSGPTTRRIMDDGINSSIAEACLPVKIFHGHVISLKDKVDYIFIPRYTSISRKKYVCPEVGGLPDLVRNSIEGLPEIIDVNVDLYKNFSQGKEAAIYAGQFISKDKHKIKKAYNKAIKAYKASRSKHLFEKMFRDELNYYTNSPDPKNNKLQIGVIGHSYIIQDDYLNMGLLNRLREMNVEIITPKDRPGNELISMGDVLPKKIFWDFGSKCVGFARELIKEKVDGVLFVSSFGCGIDSFVSYIVEEEIREADIPFCLINIDEHSGEAGLVTRLEAFINMINRRYGQYATYISSHG